MTNCEQVSVYDTAATLQTFTARADVLLSFGFQEQEKQGRMAKLRFKNNMVTGFHSISINLIP